eukprot:CAMPEP_0202882196 /NCGR_PEP_ID=MMETSP1391-20130828/37662_1 /ASSEMBLY_ACC=CAM_ASM_000867 /TAXON_ID=1034604 /ORGANISM="Chlamydomonas leiostraca, Strain SAG 11-49" /LENGTH=166 /DNA_ID=CAMNT_0049565015 /DNA_START=225 /DNA_END=726 /DNA_ORIENTATION=+
MASMPEASALRTLDDTIYSAVIARGKIIWLRAATARVATPAAPAHNRAFNNRPAPTAPSTVQQPRQHHTLLARTCAKPSHQPTSSIKGIPSRLGLHKGGVCKKSKPFSGTIMPFQFVKPCGIDGRMTLEVLNAKIQAYDDAAKRASSAPLPPTAGKPPLLKRKASL